MSKQIKKIVIVGGGSAGWMTAATLIKCLSDRDIILIESPNISTVGVGESTLGFINSWLRLLDIKDSDFMKACDATYKLSIRFTDFYKKGAGSFHYPFGGINIEGNRNRKNDWYFKKMLFPETHVSDYADCIYPIMALVNQNKISENLNKQLPQYNFNNDAAYHFNASKFGEWLKTNYAIPKGVKHILAEVKDVKVNEDGVEHLVLDNGEKVTADLFIDCTGFRSLLIGKALEVPFLSWEEYLPNNSAWATQIPYTSEEDKKSKIVPYTDCHAIGNGWVWNIPLWNRLGSGYVYSDKYVSDEDALEEYKTFLKEQGIYQEDIEFRKIKFRVGTHEKLWHKNVAAIGLSAAFIEPLESNGLYSVHEFLMRIIRVLGRETSGFVSTFDKDCYNRACRSMFEGFSQFVALHYALSHRDDTEYWRDIGKRDFCPNLYKMNHQPVNAGGFEWLVTQRMVNYEFDDSGINCIATGLNLFPTDWPSIKSSTTDNTNWNDVFFVVSKKLDMKKEKWNNIVKDEPNHYQYLKEKIYNE